MNSPEEQLSAQDILLLRSLLGRFGGQLTQASSAASQAPATPTSIQISPSVTLTQPTESFTQPAPVPNNGIQQLRYTTQPAESLTLPVSTPIPNNGILHPRHSVFPPVITPYHSALSGAQGHPPRSTRISSTVENIGSGISSQVNQQRLAAAAVNLPSQVSLPQHTARRRRRGPAVLPPTLSPAFSINSVLSNEGSSSPLFKIKVKVYPPQASILLCIF